VQVVPRPPGVALRLPAGRHRSARDISKADYNAIKRTLDK
jgi:hypothetical protein